MHSSPYPIKQVRYIFRCRRCKTASAVDYLQVQGGWWTTYRTVDGTTRYLQADLPCPTCKRERSADPVKGRVTGTKCGPRCTGAVGPACDCQCGGANHGADHL